MAFSVSSSQLIKLIKSVTSLVFKKVTTIVCVFLRKAPTKKNKQKSEGKTATSEKKLDKTDKPVHLRENTTVIKCRFTEINQIQIPLTEKSN